MIRDTTLLIFKILCDNIIITADLYRPRIASVCCNLYLNMITSERDAVALTQPTLLSLATTLYPAL